MFVLSTGRPALGAAAGLSEHIEGEAEHVGALQVTITRVPNPSPNGADANKESKEGRGEGKVPSELSPDPESMKRGPRGRGAKRL